MVRRKKLVVAAGDASVFYLYRSPPFNRSGVLQYISGADLGVHEFGHILFGFAGQFIAVAGGTIAQLAAPLICAVMFWRQPDYFALTLTGVWLAVTCTVSRCMPPTRRFLPCPWLPSAAETAKSTMIGNICYRLWASWDGAAQSLLPSAFLRLFYVGFDCRGRMDDLADGN